MSDENAELAENRLGDMLLSAGAAIGATAIIGLLFYFITVYLFRDYGAVLFFFTPTLLGFMASVLHCRSRRRSMRACFAVSGFAMLMIAAIVFLIQWEGIICIFMASPLILLGTLLGAAIGQARFANKSKNTSTMVVSVLLLQPALLLGERAIDLKPPLRTVVSEISIAASPARVWQVLTEPVSFGANQRLMFRAGVNYPTSMLVVRDAKCLRCTLSHGDLDISLTIIREQQLLEFSLGQQQPQPMEEFNFTDHVHPPHLDGYFKVHCGRFILLPTADGNTLLRAETEYEYDIWPNFYWRWWTEPLIDGMHQGVLDIVKQSAELGARP
jgi:hypothetical protein